MATSTPNYDLRKPAGSDLVNVTTDISENMDKLDAHVHPASTVSFTPSGLIVATDVQAALEELDTKKMPADIAAGTVVQTAFNVSPIVAAGWGIANSGAYLRAVSPGTINTVRIHVTVQSGNISLAAYRADGTNGEPGTRLATTGAIACPPTGLEAVPLGSSVTLNVGDWLFMSCDNTTAAFWMLHSTGGIGDSLLAEGIAYRQTASHPAPDPAGGLIASVLRTPWLVGVTV